MNNRLDTVEAIVNEMKNRTDLIIQNVAKREEGRKARKKEGRKERKR